LFKKNSNGQKDAAEAVNTVLEEITKTLSKGGEVVLTGFGTFKVKSPRCPRRTQSQNWRKTSNSSYECA